MKKILLLLMALPVIFSCAPSSYSMAIQMRYPSPSGIDFTGKSMAVVYVHQDSLDSLVVSSLAESFAQSLEKEYFDSQRAVELFAIKSVPGAVYAARDTLVNLVIDTDSDVVFLFDEVNIGEPVATATTRSGKTDPDSVFVTKTTLPFSLNIDVYDSFSKSDEVKVFTRKGQVLAEYYSPIGRIETMEEKYEKILNVSVGGMKTAGERFAKHFLNDWKTENYSFYYYDMQNWYEAINKAYAADWKGAVDAFIELAQTRDALKRSCASFDIATCLYMAGEYDMALEWLDRSDSDYKQSNSSALRQRVKNRKKM